MTLIDLPSGSALNPTIDPTFDDGGANPNFASPSGLAFADGKVWVALGNLHGNFSPAGNSFLAAIDPSSLDVQAYELSASDGGTGCLNASTIVAMGTSLVVSCTADYFDGTVAVFDTTTQKVTQLLPLGGGPSALAIVGQTAYLGDSAGGGVMIADLGAGTVTVDSTSETAVCDTSNFNFVAGLAAGPSSTDILATCFDSAAGSLLALDPATGAALPNSAVDTASGPIAMTYVGTSGNIDTYAIVDAFGDQVQLAQWPTGGQVFTNSVALPPGSSADDVAVSGDSLFVAGGSSDYVSQLSVAGHALSATASLPAGSDPSRVTASDASTAWTSLLNTNQVARVSFP